MSSDKARISYDEKQQYRAVVMQQGRVTVEADWNEAQQIVNEEIRFEALDFVGSNGTPDDGYAIDVTGQEIPLDFLVRSGTMYVGGLRAHLAESVKYSAQQEWLDHSSDPDWVDLTAKTRVEVKREFVYLHLREQEVSAVEDSALREVALGGPDTAQRVRIIQHIVRLGIDGKDCTTGIAAALKKWESQGLHFSPDTMQLQSWGTLAASFQDLKTTSDPCDTQARGGYLGADNQLIRVQISDTNKLIWGFDNASNLYRVDVLEDHQTLQVRSRPVDSFHHPKTNQFVEVLRSAAQLSNGEYIASATGLVFQLTASYDSDTQSIKLPITLPSEYWQQTPQVFLRVWENELSFTPGTAVPLGNTGLQVTLQTTPVGKPFYVGDYWQIAVRPSTSTEVYPHRYLDPAHFQPPEGPRLWVCPLGVIERIRRGEGSATTLRILADCRNHFDNLVELTKRKYGGCCTVNIVPEDLTVNQNLQNIIDRYQSRDNSSPMKICLMPGVYSLAAPLRLEKKHSNLTIEGCHEGVIIQAAANADRNQFLDGLIVLTQADNITLRRLQLELSVIPFIEAVRKQERINPQTLEALQAGLPNINAAIGIRPVSCGNLAIQDCVFHFSLPAQLDVFGAGIFAGGECKGLTVKGNRFLSEDVVRLPSEVPPIITGSVTTKTSPVTSVSTVREEMADNPFSIFSPSKPQEVAAPTTESPQDVVSSNVPVETEASATENPASISIQGVPQEVVIPVTESAPGIISLLVARQPVRIIFGYLLLPFGTLTSTNVGTTASAANINKGQVIRSLLQDASFHNNQFSGLTFASLMIADMSAVKFEDNTVRECFAGFWLETLSFWVLNLQTILSAQSSQEESLLNKSISQVFRAFLLDPIIVFGVELGLFYPLPQSFTPSQDSLLGVEITPTSDTASVSRQRSLLEIQPFFKAAHNPGLSISLQVSDNTIDALITNSTLSGIGLLTLGDVIQQGEMIMSANKIRNQAANAPTVAILGVQPCTITGNLILNETSTSRAQTIPSRPTQLSATIASPSPTLVSSSTSPPNSIQTTPLSLVLLPRGVNSNGIAVTGNVLQGLSTLSLLNRPNFLPPLDTWVFANTEM